MKTIAVLRYIGVVLLRYITPLIRPTITQSTMVHLRCQKICSRLPRRESSGSSSAAEAEPRLRLGTDAAGKADPPGETGSASKRRGPGIGGGHDDNRIRIPSGVGSVSRSSGSWGRVMLMNLPAIQWLLDAPLGWAEGGGRKTKRGVDRQGTSTRAMRSRRFRLNVPPSLGSSYSA